MAAARAIAGIVDESELREDYIIPSVFNRDVAPAVAAAVAEQARAAGTAMAGDRSATPPATRSPRAPSRASETAADARPRMSERRVTITGATGLMARGSSASSRAPAGR